MKILVTGGAGFIGSHIVEQFQDQAEIRVLDDLSSGFEKNLHGLRHEFIQGSILDAALLQRAVQGVDYVFHLAAMANVPESIQNPVACVQKNTIGTLSVLEAAAKAGVKKLVFSSSAAIYGNDPTVPKIETMLPQPASPYAVTKLDGEFYCGLSAKALPTVCLRYFNVFGPRQNPRSQYAAAIPGFIDRALKNEKITIYGDGRQTRDFISVKDVAAANCFFATQTSATGVFNVASGHAISIKELAAMICQLTGSKAEIQFAEERAGDVKHSLADIGKLRSSGFTPAENFQNALLATIRSYAKLAA